MKKRANDGMNLKKTLQYVLTLVVVIAAAYFFYLQFKNNADVISAYHFTIKPYYLLISFVLGSAALLCGPIVWRLFVNSYLDKRLNYAEGFSLYCVSAMFKYIPGKIWTYAAQIALMSSKGTSKVVLIYINIVGFICLFFDASMLFVYYYFFYMKQATFGLSVVVLSFLLLADVVFIIWSNSILNYLIIRLRRVFKIELQPINTKRSIFIYAQVIYFFAFIIFGLAFYFLGLGINIEIPFSNIVAVVAAIIMSVIIGLMAFFSIGGLGVREGTMFFLLKQFSSIEAAVILPILGRLLIITAELLLLMMAVIIGVKFGYFNKINQQNKI